MPGKADARCCLGATLTTDEGRQPLYRGGHQGAASLLLDSLVRMRRHLLFLSQTLPYPPDSGVAIRGFHVLRLLARAFDVTALCFARAKGGAVPQHDLARRLAALRQLAEVEAFPVPQEHNVWRLAWDHLRSVGLNRAYTTFAYDSATVTVRIRELLRRRRFDLIHMDSIMLSRYLPLLGEAPVVCAHPDIQSLLLKRRAQVERHAWRRAYLLRQAHLMKVEEQRWCGRFQCNVVVSETDRTELQRIVPGAKCAVVPNGVDIETFRPGPGRDEGILFVGESTWFPNRDAMQYFCTEILPRIRGAGALTPVRWVGRASDQLRREYSERYAVELTGYVPDVRPYLGDAACYVVPLRVGGGTRMKILDAWAMGKAVVSTSAGCEGLAAEDGRNILIRDDPHSFAQAVCAVLRDAPLRLRLGAEGRSTVERHYSWERIGASMLALYSSLPQAKSGFRSLRAAEASA
jgi:glycosyltransferase involved in cell wall biosynthesis